MYIYMHIACLDEFEYNHLGAQRGRRGLDELLLVHEVDYVYRCIYIYICICMHM